MVVSDNSTTREFAAHNLARLREFIDGGTVRYIRPPGVLSPPENFEFALPYASGDAVVYLTDKMIIRPHTLSRAQRVFEATGAQIVNWDYRIFEYDRSRHTHPESILDLDPPVTEVRFDTYSPLEALWFKAHVLPDRTRHNNRTMAKGKIIYGAYRRELIEEILEISGTLFGGATHDYSAMVQALSVAKLGAEILAVGMDFAGLSAEKSLGSLTADSASAALDYYNSFGDSEIVMANLMVPGLFASQHNMVAHDYLKFLALHGLGAMLNRRKWLDAITSDLSKPGRTWADNAQRDEQLGLMKQFATGKAIQRPMRGVLRVVVRRLALVNLLLWRYFLGAGRPHFVCWKTRRLFTKFARRGFIST